MNSITLNSFATVNSAMMNNVNNCEQCAINSIDSCEQYVLWEQCFEAKTAMKATKEATIKVAKVYEEARPLVIESSDAI